MFQAISRGAVLAVSGAGGLVPTGTRVNVFDRIFLAFLILGTLVGVVVIAYMLLKAYRYRDRGSWSDDDIDRPILGELPGEDHGGRKLFVSFSISAVIVISLIIWTYGTLLYVENQPAQADDALEIHVEAFQFGWEFTYPNGHATQGELRVPVDRTVVLAVTSRDVFHNLGVPGLRVKTDAMPGQETETWFIADKTGTYGGQCYELCGAGHSYMTAEVIVMEPEEFEEWYANTEAS